MNLISIFITAVFALLCIASPGQSLFFAKEALLLCADSVVPSLFPFFVCSGLLIRLGAAHGLSRIFSRPFQSLFKISGNASLAMIMGIISGYPVGAKTASDLVNRGLCSKSEGEKLLGFCNNSGPLFILGAVAAGMIGDPKTGVLLYIAHFAAAVTAALLLRGVKCEILPPTKNISKPESLGSAFGDSVISAVNSVFTICGFVVVFYTFLNLVSSRLALTPAEKTLLFGIFEPSGGCFYAVRALKNSPVVMYTVISAIIAWSGISVHLQVLGIIKETGLSPKYYFTGKLITAAAAPLYTFILICVFPSETPVFMPMYQAVPVNICGYLCFIGLMCLAIVAAMQLMLIISSICEKRRSLRLRCKSKKTPADFLNRSKV